MADAVCKIKIMPNSPDANLDEIEQKAKQELEKLGAKMPRIEREPVAFGLNAILITFAIEESTEQDPLTDILRKIPNVNSAEIIDYRRAFG